MPWGDWVNELPTGFFLAVHITAFAIGAAFALDGVQARPDPARLGVLALRIGQLHLHDLPPRLDRFPLRARSSEVIALVAFTLVFLGAVMQVVGAGRPAVEAGRA